MTDLAAWLLAQIAEDEAVARAASSGPWTYGGIESVAGGSLYCTDQMVASILWDNEDPRPIRRRICEHEADANGAHMARHDPARVLAECAAKRELVDEHLATRQHPDQARLGYQKHCHTCGQVNPRVYPCPTLRIIAQPYRDREGWRDEWAVAG